MKISISVRQEDLDAIDAYARETGVPSRSAVIQYAIRRLTSSPLGSEYEHAWREWEASGAAAEWEASAGDGFLSAPGSGGSTVAPSDGRYDAAR